MMSAVLLKLSDHARTRLEEYRHILAEEMKLPNVKQRHLFTARLRVILFVSSWVLLLAFFPDIFSGEPFLPLILNVGFLVTALCYLIVCHSGRIFLSVVMLEIFADVVSQTVIIYILGLHSWAPFLIYGLYITAAGILSGYHVGLIASTVALVFYNALFLLVRLGMIQDFYYQPGSRQVVEIFHLEPYLNLIFLPLVFVIIVYSVWIANYFSKIKELALERRNIQLTALNRIGATIRKVVNVKNVIEQVLDAVVQGLGFDVCILALVEGEGQRCIRFFLNRQNSESRRLEEILGVRHEDFYLPLESKNNSAYQSILKNKVLVRSNLAELIYGIEPEIPLRRAMRAQKVLGFKKFVITPLVAEQKVMGAIIGVSKKPFVDETVIDMLDHFANQAALAIESAQLLEALRQKNEELVQANKVKSEFLTIMSHELRTPLNAVIGYTEALLEGAMGDVSRQQNKAMGEVLANAQNLLDLINSILDLAKLEAGKMEINLDAFDLQELAQTVKASLVPLMEKKRQNLSIHTQPGMPFIHADAVKTRQIFMNLIGNAIKFTDAGGEIDVFLEHHESCRDLFAGDFADEKPEDKVQASSAFLIRVRDSGIGIKKENLGHIFDLFRQVDSSHTRRHEGTGLGLALTRQLVQLHKGFIAVKSEYGRGTEFKILLPHPGLL